MKSSIKKLFIGLLFVVMLMPNYVFAAKIAGSKIGAVDSVKIGETIVVPFYINLSGVDKTSNNSFGIFMVDFDLMFDDDIFRVIDIKSNGFDSKIYKENGEYSIISVINNDNTGNACFDNILYCGEYEVIVTFAALDTTEKSTIIKMGDVSVGGFQLSSEKATSYKYSDLEYVKETVNKSRTITINKNENGINNTAKSIVNDNRPNIDEEFVKTVINKRKGNVDSDKSSNNYLDKLTVKGYAIDFYKRTDTYDIVVADRINSLDIDAVLEDKTAVLEIVGANDLKKNGNKVEIIVTAEDGSKMVYTINVKHESDIDKKLSKGQIITNIRDFFKKYKIYFIIGVSGIILLTIIIIIVNKVSDNKLGNKFEGF